MAAAMAELTRQNQEDRGNAEPESQLRGTTSRRLPHLEKEKDQMRKVMVEMRGNMRRANPIEDLVHRTDPLSRLPLTDNPCLLSSRCLHWIHTMEHVTHLIILLLSRLPCTFKESHMRLCVEPSLPLLKDRHECDSVKYPRTQ